MNDKLKEKAKIYGTKAKEFAGKVSKKVWIALGIAVVVLIAAVVIFRMTRPYVVLITGSTTDELSAVISWLDEQNYSSYRLEGDTIYVPESQAVNLKARLLQAGYPRTGYSWSTYLDGVGALSTESERTSTWLINVMENMSAIIRSFDRVRDAKVIISPGEDNRYVLSSDNVIRATATVKVDMADGRPLGSSLAETIQHMVANTVQGLQVDSVVIGDNLGNLYSGGVNYTSDLDASNLKIQLEEQYSNKIRTQLMQWLNALYGEGNAQASVNCVVELGYSTIDSRVVDLPDYAKDGSTKGAGIIGSIIWNGAFALNPDGTVGGVVGTTTNADFSDYVEDLFDPDSGLQSFNFGGQTDMDNTWTETHTIRSAAYISDVTVAVTINSNTAGLVNIADIRAHAATTAGITPVVTETMTADEYLSTKISVLAEPFYNTQPITDPALNGEGENNIFGLPVPDWVILAAAAGLLLFLIILLVVILLLRGKKKKKQRKLEAEQQSIEEMLASVGVTPQEPVGADVMSLQTERSMELRQSIRKFAEENPEIAAQLVKTWLRGGDDNG